MVTLNDLRPRHSAATRHADILGATRRRSKNPPAARQAVYEKSSARAANDARFVGPADLKRLNVDVTGQVVSTAPGKPAPVPARVPDSLSRP
jgi:hypothetical protein